MEKIKNNNIKKREWTPDDWGKMVENLRKLTEEQLRELATRAGINFEGGNITVQDTGNASAKEQFILVLDEVSKEILTREYERIMSDVQGLVRG